MGIKPTPCCGKRLHPFACSKVMAIVAMVSFGNESRNSASAFDNALQGDECVTVGGLKDKAQHVGAGRKG